MTDGVSKLTNGERGQTGSAQSANEAPVDPVPSPGESSSNSTSSANARSLARRLTFLAVKEHLIRLALLLCAMASIAISLAIVFVLLSETVLSSENNPAFFSRVSPSEFFTAQKWTPTFADAEFGVLPLVCGTFLVAGIAALIGLPVGLTSSIYLSEYAGPRTRAIVRPILEILAGIPTIVYGYFALVFITPYVLKPIFQDWLGFRVGVFNAASAGIVVGIMIIPMVSSLSEDALRAVPRSLREAGYALGSTKLDVSVRIVVPAASSGIFASFLLAISRAIGETMAVTIAAGNQPNITANPLESVQTMTCAIVSIAKGDIETQSAAFQSIYAVGLALFVMTLIMNILSQLVMSRFREVYE